MKKPNSHSSGFTVVELLMALAISGIVFIVIYAFFIAQSQTYTLHSQDIELQQNLRVNMQRIERELRQAGYNPGGLAAEAAESDGRDNNCNGTTDEGDDTSTLLVKESEVISFQTALPSEVSFAIDSNGDGLACGDQERISYTLNGSSLERNGQSRMENVEALDFVYLDKHGAPVTAIEDIRSVQVSIVGRIKSEKPDYTNTHSYLNLRGSEILAPQNDGYRRRMLSTEVFCRNLID